MTTTFMKEAGSSQQRRKFTDKERKAIYRAWLHGVSYAELALTYGTRRQTTRGIVLRFHPQLEDYRLHDYHRRRRRHRKHHF